MSKNIKAMLADKLAKNTQRHAAAQQDSVVEYGRIHIKIPVDSIDPNPYQPRQIFPQNEIEALAHSIAETGLLQPIMVRPNGDRYQLIAGERRWRAHKLLGKPTIESLVGEAEESDLAIYALAQNIDREDLSDYEIGKSLRQVEELFPTKKKLAEALGLNREDMYRYFAYDSLPKEIIARLDINPRLLGRKAAADLKRVLQEAQRIGDISNSDINTSAMKCWQMLEDAELDQTKLPAHLVRMLTGIRNEGRADDRDVIDIKRASRRVGTIVRDSRHFVVKIQVGTLTRDQERELGQFVRDMVSRGV